MRATVGVLPVPTSVGCRHEKQLGAARGGRMAEELRRHHHEHGPEDLFELLREQLIEVVDQGMPGAFVYVDDPDGSATFLTAGVADLVSKRRMTPDAHYRIGSTTKSFTAVVALQLVAEGRLRLSDLVSRWISGLPEPHHLELTVEHLLRMSSGLFDFVDHPTLLDLDANRVAYSLDRVLDLVLGGRPAFRPGERYAYCNSNFCVLQAIIEASTARTLGREISDRILDPLHMRNTCYPDEADLSLPEPYIRGYEFDASNQGWKDCTEVFCGLGDGAMVSTALDVSRFFRALFNGQLVSGPLLAEMREVVHDDPSSQRAYGLGLIAERLPCRTVWGHSGGGFGFNHSPFIDLDSGRLVIAMQNGTYGFRISTVPREQQPRLAPELRCLAYG